MPLQTIMAKTRHRNPRTTMRYIRPSAEAIAQITEKLLDLGRPTADTPKISRLLTVYPAL